MEYKGNKVYWVVTEVFIGPTEWTDNDVSQEHPCAVFEETKKLIEYIRREQKKHVMPRFNIFEIRWKPGAETPNTSQYLEGLPTEERVKQDIDDGYK